MTIQPSREQKLEMLRMALREEMTRRGLDAPPPARARLCIHCGKHNANLRFAGCDPCRELRRPAVRAHNAAKKLRRLAETIEKGER